MNRKNFIFLFFLILVTAPVRAEVPAVEKIFFEANQAYQSQSYEEALRKYQEIQKMGFESGALYYNIGNCFYRLGDFGDALLYYEKAESLIPQDEDLFANKNLAKNLLHPDEPTVRLPWYEAVPLKVRETLPLKSWIYLSAALLYALCAVVSFGFFNKKISRVTQPYLKFAAAGLLVVFIFTAWKGLSAAGENLAMVTEPEVLVRYSPSFSGSVSFRLHEGTKLKIVREQENWVYIHFEKGRNGWIPKDSLERVSR